MGASSCGRISPFVFGARRKKKDRRRDPAGPPSQAFKGMASRSTGLFLALGKAEQAESWKGNQTATRDSVQTTFRWDQRKSITPALKVCSHVLSSLNRVSLYGRPDVGVMLRSGSDSGVHSLSPVGVCTL